MRKIRPLLKHEGTYRLDQSTALLRDVSSRKLASVWFVTARYRVVSCVQLKLQVNERFGGTLYNALPVSWFGTTFVLFCRPLVVQPRIIVRCIDWLCRPWGASAFALDRETHFGTSEDTSERK